MAKILLSGGGPFLQIVQGLGKQHEYIALTPEMTKSLRDAEFKAIALGEIVNEQLQFVASQQAALATLGVLNNISKVNLGLLTDPIKQAFLDFIPAFLWDNTKNLVLLVHSLDTIKPEVTLVHNDVEPVTRLVALWAKQHGVPCIHIPHAVYLGGGKGPVGTDVHDLCTASHLAAAGWFQKQWYVERGFLVDRIREVGIPRFDRYATLTPNREKACALLKLNPRVPTVVYFSSWGQRTSLLGANNEVQEAYLAFLAAAKGLRGCEFIVKLHPNAGDDKWHIDMAKEAGVRCIIVKQFTDIVLQAASCAISYESSGSLFIAALLGVPVLSVKGFPNDDEVLKVGVAPAEIAAGIQKALTAEKPNMQAFLLKYIGLHDGSSTKRAVEYVKEICQLA